MAGIRPAIVSIAMPISVQIAIDGAGPVRACSQRLIGGAHAISNTATTASQRIGRCRVRERITASF